MSGRCPDRRTGGRVSREQLTRGGTNRRLAVAWQPPTVHNHNSTDPPPADRPEPPPPTSPRLSMRIPLRLLSGTTLALLATFPALPADPPAAPPAPIAWKKIIIDRAFRSEGVAIADVNRDGLPDI